VALSLNDSLSKLERLSPERLHETSQRLRADLGGAEWKMALCLLATVRTRSFRKLGYSNITEYAEKALSLSGKKAGCLLGTARALEHLPLLSEAFRQGRIGWGKVRAIRGLATPETEEQWLEFALAHSTDEVVRKVSLSPRAWKRHQALQSSLEGSPVVTEGAVAEVLAREDVACRSVLSGHGGDVPIPAETADDRGGVQSKVEARHGTPPSASLPSIGRDGQFSSPPIQTNFELPTPPKTIRLVLELTPDQYALYERAEARVRAQERKQVPRAVVLTKMAESVLNNGTARSRAKHQVLIHTQPDTGQTWYDTQRGPLPVHPTVLQQAAAKRAPLQVGPALPVAPEKSPPGPKQAYARQPIPNAILRQVFALAGHQCQCCGARGCPLDVHHTQPVSEGGGNSLKTLRLLCQACHSLEHESDFAEKPRWRTGRSVGLRKSKARAQARARNQGKVSKVPEGDKPDDP
jgi:HNH endonuclease